MATSPSFSQIKALVAAIRQKVSTEKAIGIRSLVRWTGAALQHDGDQDYAIRQCDSPLAFRLALREPGRDKLTKLLITNLEEQDLGDDILLRLAKRRLFQINSWQIVRSRFDAHAVDPRLTQHAWIAEMLLDLVPREGYPPARGGFLDAETVWPLLLARALGLRAESPDLTSLLKWSLAADAAHLLRQCSAPFRSGAAAWMADKAGPIAGVILGCMERLERADAVPLGLAAGVVYHPAAAGKLEKTAGKLEERFLGGASPPPEHMLRWSAAATEVVRSLRHTEPKTYRQTIQRADELLRELQADPMAHLSDTSPLGFDQRLAKFGEQLSETLDGGEGNLLSNLSEAKRRLGQHDLAVQEARRLERVDMALRLVRWLASRRQDAAAPQSFVEAATEHVREGGFVDWARLSLRSGDPVRNLSKAYASLFDQVTQIREEQSHRFSQLLADWTAAGSKGTEVILVERVLEEVVAPLAAADPVLVIVVDGMSVAVSRELLADITRRDWIALAEPGRNFNRPGIAAIPSVTEFSRTSLLCGGLRQGGQEHEKTAFAEQPALLARSRSGSPPILFHKASLQEEGDSSLTAEVRKEIASTQRRVVGVVVNAVDDHLLKGEQIDTRWYDSRDEIKVLPALLHEARLARRLVVLLSDHGHVLDCQAAGRPYKDVLFGGERWRPVTGEAAADELQVSGPRVMTKDKRLIAPWSERVRYGGKKNGYHGGLTPQEMVVPITILSSTDDFPQGWTEQPLDTPTWWDEPVATAVAVSPPPPKLKPQFSGALFDLEAEDASAAAPTSPAESDKIAPPWVSRLLASPVFAAQKRLGGRGVPADEVFAKLLSALDLRGGKLTSAALARTLEFAPFRLAGMLSKAETVLNVDGYNVLRRDDASDTVELNRDLLLKQFDLVD